MKWIKIRAHTDEDGRMVHPGAEAEYLMSNDPPTVIATIDELLRLRAQVASLEKEADWLATAAADNG